MDYFYSLKDSDIFENPSDEPKQYTIRPTSKGFVIDSDDKIALLHVGSLYGLQGGGIEKGETSEVGFIRECEEEIGCKVEIISYIGKVLQTRFKLAKKYEIHYFVAKVIGEKGKPTTTEEDEKSIPFEWYSESEVLTLLKTQIPAIPKEDYPMQFNGRTHLAAFKKYLEMKK